MLDFRYCLLVLALGLVVAASWPAQADVCLARGAKNDQSCSGRKEEEGDILKPTPSMVQRDVLEFAMRSIDEERREAQQVAAQISEVSAPDVPLSNVEMARAAQPQSHTGSPVKADSRGDVDSLILAFDRRCTATATVGVQLIRSVERRVAAEFREFLGRLGVWKLHEVFLSRASWTWALFLPPLLVGFIVLFIAVVACRKDTVTNKERDMRWFDPKSRPARGSFRGASSMSIPQQATQASLPPSVMGLLPLPGLLTPGRRSATPASVRAHSPKPFPDIVGRGGHLCAELVVPETKECSLSLPEIVASNSSMSGVLSIDDANGMAVLYGAYSLAVHAPAGPHDLPGNGKRLILRSVMEDITLASCKDVEPETAGGPPQMAIFNRSEKPFGILQATSPGPKSGYLVSLSTGKKMSIRRDIQALSSCVIDEDGWLLACTEEGGEHGRTICVSPQVDVGLMALTILGIDILDITMAARGPSDH